MRLLIAIFSCLIFSSSSFGQFRSNCSNGNCALPTYTYRTTPQTVVKQPVVVTYKLVPTQSILIKTVVETKAPEAKLLIKQDTQVSFKH